MLTQFLPNWLIKSANWLHRLALDRKYSVVNWWSGKYFPSSWFRVDHGWNVIHDVSRKLWLIWLLLWDGLLVKAITKTDKISIDKLTALTWWLTLCRIMGIWLKVIDFRSLCNVVIIVTCWFFPCFRHTQCYSDLCQSLLVPTLSTLVVFEFVQRWNSHGPHLQNVLFPL